MKIKQEEVDLQLLYEIYKLDRVSYAPEYLDTFDWYVQRYMEIMPLCITARKAGVLIGYALVCGIKRSFYTDIVSLAVNNDIGVSSKEFIPLNESVYAYLTSYVVKKRYQRHRIGSLLIETMLATINSSTLPCKSITALSINPTSMHILTRQGFELLKATDTTYIMEYGS